MPGGAGTPNLREEDSPQQENGTGSGPAVREAPWTSHNQTILVGPSATAVRSPEHGGPFRDTLLRVLPLPNGLNGLEVPASVAAQGTRRRNGRRPKRRDGRRC